MEDEVMTSTGIRPDTEIAARFRKVLSQERHLLRDLLQEHRELHEQNMELVRQLVEQPKETGRIAEFRAKINQQKLRYNLLKAQNTEMANNYQNILLENNNLFKLYIASHRLHSTLDMEEVLEVISEIILNLIGAEQYSIYLYDEQTRHLAPATVRGMEYEAAPIVEAGKGAIGLAVLEGKKYYMADTLEQDDITPETPLLVIPLNFRDRPLGAIALYRLLSHKQELREVDYALFDYLATHAAMALHSAKLYNESELRVSKMKSFLNMMQTTETNTTANGDQASERRFS